MRHFKVISDYCDGINIPSPKHPHFDIRSFEENMESVHEEMTAFRHEFYAIAIKADGDGKLSPEHFRTSRRAPRFFLILHFNVDRKHTHL